MGRNKATVKPNDEWIGALLPGPGLIESDGAPTRPDMLLWMLPSGAVLNAEVLEPGTALAHVVDNFHQTTQHPMYGKPHVPARVRVASESLAAVLRPALEPDTEVLCAPTPEADEVAQALADHFAAGARLAETFLGGDASPEAVAAFFEAAARMFRAEPWKLVPDDTSVIAVSIPELGIQEAVLSLIGQLGESRGFLLFEDLDDFEDFLDAAEALEAGAQPEALPSHFAVHFERGADLESALRKEIAEHQWQVARADAYPMVVRFAAEGLVTSATARDLRLAEGLARALTALRDDPDATRGFKRSMKRPGEPFVLEVQVESHGGPLAITLTAPYDAVLAEGSAPPPGGSSHGNGKAH